MDYQFEPYSIALAVSALITLGLGLYAIRHTRVPGANAFAACMLIGFIWSTTNAMEMMGRSLEVKLIWANIQYPGYAFAPLAWLIMVSDFSGKQREIRGFLPWLFIIPVITSLLVWFDPYLGLVRNNFSLISGPLFPMIGKTYGPWFWVHLIHCYLLNVVSIILLLRVLFVEHSLYRKQAAFLLTGLGMIMVFNLSYVLGFGSLIDLSPLSFTLSGVVIARGIFSNQLFSIAPIARAQIVEEMPTAVIVYDHRLRLLDLNNQAVRLLGQSKNQLLGSQLDSIDQGKKLLALLNSLATQSDSVYTAEIELVSQGQSKTFEVFYSTLVTPRTAVPPRIILLNDVTSIRLARDKITAQDIRLGILEDRERLARDLHDNLGQALSFAAIQSQSITRELDRENLQIAQDQMKRLQEIISMSHSNIRQFVYDIRNPEERDLSFCQMLEEYRRKIPEETGMIFHTDVPERLDSLLSRPDRKYHLLNIIREAVNNCIKHSHCSCITLQADGSEQAFWVRIQDDGCGFDVDEQSKKTTSGMKIMQERAQLIGSGIEINSQQGTTITLTYPPGSGGWE